MTISFDGTLNYRHMCRKKQEENYEQYFKSVYGYMKQLLSYHRWLESGERG